MSYTVYDFAESLKQSKRKDVKRVAAAWGQNGSCAEWDGGFLCEMADGKWMYLTGWCDSTGWGCQDGIDVKMYDIQPDLESIDRDVSKYSEGGENWELDPVDLNRFLRGEIGELD